MATDDTRKAVGGWRAMKQGDRPSRRERMAEDRQKQVENIKGSTKNKKLQAIREAQEHAENEVENPLKHIKEGYKAIRKREASKKRMKLNGKLTLLKLTEITEAGGVICEVKEAGFDMYEIIFMQD